MGMAGYVVDSRQRSFAGQVCGNDTGGEGKVLFQRLLTTTGTKDTTKYSTKYKGGNLPKVEEERSQKITFKNLFGIHWCG